jgi:hypothetical protein
MLRFKVAALRFHLTVNGNAPFSGGNVLYSNGFAFDG